MNEHEKVYVVCENLCMEEGLTKNEIMENFQVVAEAVNDKASKQSVNTLIVAVNNCKSENDFAIITGSISVNDSISGEVEVNYPIGFNKNNCVVIGGMVNNIGGVALKSGMGAVYGNLVYLNPTVTLLDNKIRVRVTLNGESTNTYNYKFVLLRFFDGEGADACFTGDTLVLTDEGNIPIKDINIGDRIFTEIGLKNVTKKYAHTVNEIYNITINDTVIKASATHPFKTGRGKVFAKDLIENDVVFDSKNNELHIDNITITNEECVVYEINTIADSYYITHNSILVYSEDLNVHA